jgi:hypothetical protein
MSNTSRTRNLALSSATLCLIAISGTLSAIGQGPAPGDGSELSGPPQMNANYQTRDARQCKPLATPPTQGQAAALIQCTMEQDRPTGLFLMQDVQVEVGVQRSYLGSIDSNLPEIDITAPIYPLSGSLKVYWCNPVGLGNPAGGNCQVSPTPVAVGKCWKTTFGDWKCNLLGPAPASRSGLPGPMTY